MMMMMMTYSKTTLKYMGTNGRMWLKYSSAIYIDIFSFSLDLAILVVYMRLS